MKIGLSYSVTHQLSAGGEGSDVTTGTLFSMGNVNSPFITLELKGGERKDILWEQIVSAEAADTDTASVDVAALLAGPSEETGDEPDHLYQDEIERLWRESELGDTVSLVRSSGLRRLIVQSVDVLSNSVVLYDYEAGVTANCSLEHLLENASKLGEPNGVVGDNFRGGDLLGVVVEFYLDEEVVAGVILDKVAARNGWMLRLRNPYSEEVVDAYLHSFSGGRVTEQR